MVERYGRRAGLVAFAVIVLMISAAACSKDTPTATGSTGTTTTEAPTEEPSSSGGGGGTIAIGDDQANDHGSADVSGMDEFKLEQDNFYFNPTVLTGSAGQSLKIEVDNEGSVPHTFTIDDQNVDVQIEPGENASVDVTFPDSGFVEFYCKFHRSQGMAGELKVA